MDNSLVPESHLKLLTSGFFDMMGHQSYKLT